jgi:hypothetical protein
MFEEIWYKLRYDNSFKIQVIIGLLFIVLISYWVLRPIFITQNEDSGNSSSNQTAQPQGDSGEGLTLSEFNNITALTPFVFEIQSAEIYGYIGYQDERIGLVTKDKFIKLNNQDKFIFDITVVDGSNYLLEGDNDVVLLKPNGVSFNYPSNVIDIDYVAPDKIYFLQSDKNGLKLYSSGSYLINQGNELIGSFKIDTDSYSSFEVKEAGGNIYLAAFQDYTRKGGFDLYVIRDGSNLKKMYSINELVGYRFTRDYLLYTKKDSQENYETNIVEFMEDEPVSLSVNFKDETEKQDLKGDVIANRCDIKNKKIFCLVKKTEGDYTNQTLSDKILIYDIDKQSSSLIAENVEFSSSLIRIDESENIYIISQNNQKLYKFENSK